MTQFTAPLNVGGLDSDDRTGQAYLVQQTTLTSQHNAANPAKFLLPNGANVIEYRVGVETPFAAGALVTAQRVQTYVGATANLVSEIAVSASGQYNMLRTPTAGGNHSVLRNVSATISTFVSTKALASAATLGQGMLTVHYLVP